MSFDTGNPIGSTDFRDLSDNASNFDKFANGPQPTYQNRLGELKLSITGMNEAFNNAQDGREAEFQTALQATGFVDIGNYAAGLTVTGRNQVFARNGVFYSANAALVLPYTLTGNWAAEGSNFILRADAPLRSDLAASSGAALIGRPSGQTVATELDALASAIANANTAIGNLVIRLHVQAPDTATLRTLALADASSLIQLTNVAAKVLAVPAQSTVAWAADTLIAVFNDGSTTMQVSAASGVTIKVAAGGSLNVPPAGLVYLKRLAADKWLLIGQGAGASAVARIKAFGDSITVGVGASSPAFGYINRETEILNIPITNKGVNADCTWDCAQKVFNETIEINEVSQIMIGTNDSRRYGTTSNNLDTFKRAHLALLAWLAIPEIGRLRANNPLLTYTGTWATGTAYGSNFVRVASAPGAKVSMSFTGTCVYACFTRQFGATSTGTVRIDGNVVGSITSAGYNQVTNNGLDYGPSLYRFSGLSNTTHTIEFTVDSASGAQALAFEGFAVPSASLTRKLNVINIPRQTAAGGGVDATNAAYNALVLENVNLLKSDGLKITLADAATVINPATDLAADGLHPNDAGHLKIAQTAVTAFAL